MIKLGKNELSTKIKKAKIIVNLEGKVDEKKKGTIEITKKVNNINI